MKLLENKYSAFSKKEISLIKKLNTPKKIQDFLNSLNMNFEPNGDECNSPLIVMRTKKAHCIEGAIFAALILRYHGREALLLDLETTNNDFDHVVALFKEDGYWGAISKTNHAVLRYREPIYRDIKELVMSYFHEYFLNKTGLKTLRAYSDPVNLKIFDKKNWMNTKEEVWYIPEYLTKIKHHKILNQKQIKNLRKADIVERKAGMIIEYNSTKRKTD